MTGTGLFAIFCACSNLTAQESNPSTQTNEVAQTEENAAGDLTQANETADEELTDTNQVAGTNETVKPGPDARTRRLLRRSQSRGSAASVSNRTPRTGGAETNNAPSPFSYSAFRIITERNIFDPNRSPRSARPAAAPKTVESFSLVGTMSYEKGVFAFFDGTSSEYKKVLKPDESIAGYKLVAITPDSVKLMLNTNVLELSVGTSMRRRDDGSWQRSAASESYAAASTSSSSASDTASSGADSDILKKMMMRREKE